MRRVLLLGASLLGVIIPQSEAVTLQRGVEGEELEPHSRFTSLLSEARKQMLDSASALASVEGAVEQRPAAATAGAAPGAAETAAKMLPAALAQLQSSVDQLKRVHSEVDRSTSLDSAVKAQILWNLDKMVADSQRLRDPALAPYAREAVVKALRLRFGVLLTPSFWREAVDRKLLDGSA